MIHYTCDLCAKDLADEPRFIVKVEAFAAHNPAELTEADLDDDHMEAVSQMIQQMEETDAPIEAASLLRQVLMARLKAVFARLFGHPTR